MTDRRPYEQPVPTCSRPVSRQESYGLASNSYTVQRLQHASPEHLHVTSRRFFIGPFPRGWLASHRRSWYKSFFGFKDYSSRTATFSAIDPSQPHHPQTDRRAGGGLSFPQPDDVDFDELDEVDGEDEDETGDEEVDESRSRPDDDDRVGTTRIAPFDTTQQSQPLGEPEEGHAAGQPIPARPKKKVAFPETPSPALNRTSTSGIDESYFTPPESRQQKAGLTTSGSTPRITEEPQDGSPRRSSEPSASFSVGDDSPVQAETTSQTSLLRHGSPEETGNEDQDAQVPERSDPSLQQEEPWVEEDQATRRQSPGADNANQSLDNRILRRVTSARFSVEDRLIDRQRRVQERWSRPEDDTTQRRKQTSACREGEIIRAEKMLVRIDVTKQSVPNEYCENSSTRVETRPVEKWREYLVVCRRGTHKQASALLQLYKTRVIPKVDVPQVKKRCSHEILLTHGTTKANLFSNLDKTLAVWHPFGDVTRILIMRARSAAHSVEWYTFIRECLGWKQSSALVVHVPDLDVSLRLKNPFARRAAAQRPGDARECSVALGSDAKEQAIASAIINTCMNTLEECTQYARVLDLWTKSEKMGLAWRRYDRLEWVQGANEHRMYGMHTMRNSHELELRPRQHYPTFTESAGQQRMEEPSPMEGFMILLTSQMGAHKRWGKMYSRKLYFFTEDQYLCFCKPAKATPPAPPRLATICGTNIPRTSDIVRETPLVYNVDPFPLRDGKIPWLTTGRKAYARRHDAEAYAESRRNINNLTSAEGYINLCRVSEVRAVSASDSQAEENHANGGDVEFHGEAREATSRRGSGTDGDELSQQAKRNRRIELVLDDGLVVRLRTYNRETREEWMKRLREMMTYWKARTHDDIVKLKSVRQHNLDELEIDEHQESVLGHFAQKWQVARAEASPELFHICRLSGCRAIKISGQLYRKTRRRGAFNRSSVILMEGRLLIFQGSVRKWSGAPLQHTHHQRQSVLDLRDCYVYSGIITCSDLLYHSQKANSNLPGHRSTPRIYLSDGMTSTDEDTETCFVIWRGSRKALFRSHDEQQGIMRTKWRQVAALGVPGKSIVFKARSRAERDLWVLAIETEIDRMQQKEDLRIVSQ